MKTTSTKTLLSAAVAAAVLSSPLAAMAQSTPAAGSVPNSFDAPAAEPAPAAPAHPASPAVSGQAPDIARAEQALRDVITSVQGDGFDYSAFTDNLATQIRAQQAQVTPLIKSYGPLKTIEYERPEGDAHLFKVVFDRQETEWLIGFDAEDKIAALLFRPSDD